MKLSRTAAVGAALSVALLLAGCGGGSTASSSSSGPSSSSGSVAASGSGGSASPANFVVGVSNTVAGNGWREQMICSVKAEALVSKKVSKVIVVSKNGTAADQINDIQNLISQGVKVLIVDPADATKLNSVLEEAIQRGITVVAVDQAVTAKGAYTYANDQVQYGKLGAEWLFKQIGGKGKVLYMRGAAGAQADTDRNTGFQEALKANPGITVKEVYTDWDYTKAGQIAVQQLTSSDFAGVWTSGPDYTVVNAFATAKKTPVPVVGQDTNAFINQIIKGAKGAVVTNPSVVGGGGLNLALNVLDGNKEPSLTQLKPEVWDLASARTKLEAAYDAKQGDTANGQLTIPGATHYTPAQLRACKGPGE